MMSDKEKDLVKEIGDETDVASNEVEVEVEAEGVAEAESEAQELTGASTRRSETSLAATTTGPTQNERSWAALAHASVLVTFVLGISTGGLAAIIAALIPLAIWLAFRDRSRFVAFHAMQATVFQIGSLAVWIGLLVLGLAILIPAWIVTALLLIVLIGFLLLPLALILTIALPAALITLPFASLGYGLYGAYEVYAGRAFRYWLVADWIEERGVGVA